MAIDQYLLAIDQGTTSTRAILFNKAGTIIQQAQREIKQHYPQEAWVEHSPNDIWQSVLGTCQDVMTNHYKASIAGIGITNQRETTLIWDRATGVCIYPAIVWQDRRTAQLCEAMRNDQLDELIQQKTGLLLDPYFSASKIQWLLNNVPGAKKRALAGELAFGTIDSYLLWKLTNGREHCTDVTNAARTMLFNIHDLRWDHELLSLFDIPESILPEVKPNTAEFGETDSSVFGAKIPIAAMAGDQQAAAIGQACFSPGMVKSTYGTGCFIVLNTGDKVITSDNRLLSTIAYQIGSQISYALEGSIFVAGAAVQWLRDAVKLIQHTNECEAIVANTNDTGGVYLVPAFTGMGAPYWDPDARGAILGLTRDSGVAQIVRAALEAVCYQTNDLMDAMVNDGAKVQSLRVDGGMVNNHWLMQFLADILMVPVKKPVVTETTALGVAYLAGLQQGIYQQLDDITQQWQCQDSYEPTMPVIEREKYIQGWHQAVSMICGTK